MPCIHFTNPFSSHHKTNNNNKNNIKLNVDNEKKNKKQNKEIKKSICSNKEININTEFEINKGNKIEKENEKEDIKLNISNLEIDIEKMNIEVDEESNIKKENPKHIHKNIKSFIEFNNNLSFKLVAENYKNSPSYMLALCPQLFRGNNNKNNINENYKVNDAISEELESDTLTSKNNSKFSQKKKKF